MRALIDSGAMFQPGLSTPLSNPKTPLWLTIFDGPTAAQGLLGQFMTLDVTLPCETHQYIQLLLNPLARSTAVVLGCSWLLLKNPLIDWVTHKITFRPQFREQTDFF